MENLSSIWMHTSHDKEGNYEVNLFYGGGKAPVGEGTSPDGRRHAHHTLTLSVTGDPIFLFYRDLAGHESRGGIPDFIRVA